MQVRRLGIFVLLLGGLGACRQGGGNNMCFGPRHLVPGERSWTGTSSGAFELQSSGSTSSFPFSTPPPGEAPTSSSVEFLDGSVDTRSGSAAVIVDIDSGNEYAEADFPDLSTLQAGAVVHAAVDGFATVAGGGCDLSGEASLTITKAVGSRATSPDLVSADFVRSGTVLMKASPLPSAETPYCSKVSAIVHATFTLTAADFKPVYDDGSCVDVSR